MIQDSQLLFIIEEAKTLTEFLQKPLPVVLREDGYPADSRIRSAVMRFRIAMQGTSHRSAINYIAASMLNSEHRRLIKSPTRSAEWWPRTDHIIKALVGSGVLVEVPEDSGCVMFAEKRLAPTTPEAKQSNYEAMLLATAQRACDGDEARIRMLDLITRVRALYTASKVTVGGLNAVAIPKEFGLAMTGPYLAQALLFVDGNDGIAVYMASGNAISTEWVGNKAVLRFEIDGLEKDDRLTANLSQSRMLPRRETCQVMFTAAQKARKALGFLSGQKELVSKIVGEEIEGPRWLSLLASVRRVRDMTTSFRASLFGNLDIDARKAALRDPKATYELYNWLRSGDATQRARRAQASAALPFLTGSLKGLGNIVDGGGELMPAAAEITGMTVPQLRKLSGMHWQKLGALFRELETIVGVGKTFFDGVPPEKMPATRGEWAAAIQIGKKNGALSCVAPQTRQAYGRSISKDWEGHAKILKSDIFHALKDTSQHLAPLLTGEFHSVVKPCKQMFAVLFGTVGGENFGTKRLGRFSKEWHAGEPRRTAAYRALRRQAFGELTLDWKPLTKDDFKCRHGSMVWMTNEDELVEEGMTMMHCVGSYARSCISGYSHIASVFGNDGSRSTVEFTTTDKILSLVQNQARYNKEPGEDAKAVVEEFMAKHRTKKFTVKKNRNAKVPKRIVATIDASAEIKDGIRQIFADIFPADMLAWSPEQWKAAVEKHYDPAAEFVCLALDKVDAFGQDNFEDDEDFTNFDFDVTDWGLGEAA